MPSHWDFGPEHESGESAAPFDGKLRIIWADPMAWYRAALNYLDDPDAESALFPVVELTEKMARHQEWFESALAGIWSAGEDELVPAILDGNCYVVFGYPFRSHAEVARTGSAAVELESADDNFSQLAILNESPVCLEWIAYDPNTGRHPGEFGEYFETLKQTILGDESLPITPRKDAELGLLFVRPATDFDIRDELKVEFSCLVDEACVRVEDVQPADWPANCWEGWRFET